jgi:hypothetical protein
MGAVLPNNAHLHLPPNFSAFTTIQQAMELADAQECRIVGASNYYDYSIYEEFAAQARASNVFPLFGLEIICMIEDLRVAGLKVNDPGNPGKMYICGKGITRFVKTTPEATDILHTIRNNDAGRIAQMVERIAALFAQRGLATHLHAGNVVDMVVARHGSPRETVFLQERHVAQAFQEFIFRTVPAAERIATITTLLGSAPKMKSAEDFVGLQNEIRSQLMKAGKAAYVNETFVDFAAAKRLIQELGGFASYPILADGATPLTGFEDPIEGLVAHLRARGIFAAELIPGRNATAMVEKYARGLRAAGLIVTAGTEHNSLELIPMEPACPKNEALSPELKRIFYEGACVIAAHQFLNAHGQVGYVDGAGNLSAGYASAEARIADLAALGDAVIRRYLSLQARRN